MQILVRNDRTRANEYVEGSDGRLNVSARTESRAYYVSRDDGRLFSAPFEFDAAADGEFFVYLKNDDPNRTLVVSTGRATVSSACVLKAHFVSGTAAGDSVTPVNLNKKSSNDAVCTMVEGGANATGVTNLTSTGHFGTSDAVAGVPVILLSGDLIRLGQGDAIGFEMDSGTAVDIKGTLLFFFEEA